MVDNLSDTEMNSRLQVMLEAVLSKPVPIEKVVPETRLEDLDIESIRLVDLVVSMEDDFGIQIEDGKIEGIKTVGDLIALIKKKTN